MAENSSILGASPLVQEARDFYDEVAEYESDWRYRFIEDIKFANGDAYNNYQWPNTERRQRDIDKKPTLTMNQVRQHNNQISNAARKNKSEPKILAMGNGATQESANMLKQIVRHIEYQSSAQDAYTVAREFQVDGGVGYWRITTDYAGPETFDQEIYIRTMLDPLSVFMDQNCQRVDCSDAKKCLIFNTMVSKEEFELEYPEFAGIGNFAPLGVSTTGDNWVEQHHVTLAEYFRKESVRDTVVSFLYEGKRYEILKSKMPQEVQEEVLRQPLTLTRPTYLDSIKWYLIAGEQVIAETVWPGKYIPIVRILGRQTVIEGRLDRVGHTRSMLSAQHMYNYNASNQVEFGGTQGKTPWIAPAKAIEEYETYWNTANTTNHSVLVWNHVDDNNPDVPIPPPIRAEPPNFAPLYEKGMETAFNQMMMVSGQWQNQMGMMGNERTGAAIGARQEQGDTATFHFQDNYESGLITSTKILLDLIPKIYDTKRILSIQADDGTDYELEVDPQAKQAFVERAAWDGSIIKRIYNPNLGKYDVAAAVGPAIGTARQQTVDTLGLILSQNPGLTGIIGDLLLKALDFPEAQEAAQRMRRMVPPQALGTGPPPEVEQLQQVITLLQQNLAKSLDAHGKDRVKLIGKDQMRDIDAYDAETKRMAVLQKMLPQDAEGLQALIEQLVEESLHTSLLPILSANVHGLSAQSGNSDDEQQQSQQLRPPLPGAARSPNDGEWYILDPTRRTKYLRISPLAQEKKIGAGVIQGG